MQSLNWNTYEEYQLKLLKYEADKICNGVEMTSNGNLYIIEFPDVFRKYLYWVIGNTMEVFPTGQRRVKYWGRVRYKEGNLVYLEFSQSSLHRINEQTQFNVKFTDNSWNMSNQRKAVKMAGGLGAVLFPSIDPATQTIVPKLSLINKQLESNPEQYQAVQHIVAGTSKPAAYVLFGPPGTGKTVTLVEAITQIQKNEPRSHILACASRNKDADFFCLEIVKKVPRSMVHRMYAMSVDPNSVPEDLIDCCNLNDEGFFLPSQEKMMKYKIIVTTLFAAARLIGIPKCHFTHIFLDNAECALETECLIPIAGLHDESSGQLVVAGDPKQFGPLVKSRLALEYGMGVSLLERWMTTFPLYQKTQDKFNKKYITKLKQSYRSHPKILEIVGDLFSDRELTACPDTSLPSTQLSNSCANWEHLPTKGFPVIFHAVYGVAKSNGRSFSYYNTEEVEKLMDYVKKLLRTKDNSVQPVIKPGDIGIMARYKKQVQEITKALIKLGKDLKNDSLKKVKVGTVERFRGQEKRVILLSMICSSKNPCERMGAPEAFVQDEKAFYVAVTRAKALLIVVGNPTVWKKDELFYRFIENCKTHGGYRDDRNPNPS